MAYIAIHMACKVSFDPILYLNQDLNAIRYVESARSKLPSMLWQDKIGVTMRIAFLGSGAWGIALADLLCCNGHHVNVWSVQQEVVQSIRLTRVHPRLPGCMLHQQLHLTSSLDEALEGAEVICEAVTAAGTRPVFEQLCTKAAADLPIIVASKGIEQGSGLILPQVIKQALGRPDKSNIGVLSGPSYAEEVLRKMPTSVVGASHDPMMRKLVLQLFGSAYFRVYPNSDLLGVSLGGALKNVIAIAAGISDGAGFGMNSKAALMTRGLHEMRRLAEALGAQAETLYGLSGMGDLVVTCMSSLSRNYQFGRLLAQGRGPDAAKQAIGMAVEGAYTCTSALELAERFALSMPITEAVVNCISGAIGAHEAVDRLMLRAIKDENL